MATEKKTIYEDAIDLLEKINDEFKDSEHLQFLNIKMAGVVKEINDARIVAITGKSAE
jgi:hypothetical protein